MISKNSSFASKYAWNKMCYTSAPFLVRARELSKPEVEICRFMAVVNNDIYLTVER